MKADRFPFTTGDFVTVTTWGRVPESGTLIQVDDSGLTLQLGFRAARWIPWGGIRDVEIAATESRIREIAALGAQPRPVVPHPALTDDERQDM